MKITSRLIMGSALSVAAVAVAIDHTRHRLPEVAPAVLEAEEPGLSPCSLEESPCSLSESPCSLDEYPAESPCSLEESPCSLGGVSPCSL